MRSSKFYASLSIALLLSGCQSHIRHNNCVAQTYVHKYGVVVQPDYWNECGSSGEVITKLRDGSIMTQTFIDNKLYGDTTYSYPHSTQIQRRETYQNDTLIKRVVYNRAGVPQESTEYSSPQNSTTTMWYEHGQPRCVEKYADGMLVHGEYYNINNQKDSWVYNGTGERLTRDDQGYLISSDTIIGGDLAAKTTYHPNGSPKEITPIAQGQVHGERRTFYPGGDPMSVETWDNGRQQGQTTIYQNGERCAEVPYLAGQKHGVERRFGDGSTVAQEITWCDGKMHGPSYTYLGDSMQTDWYWRGRLTSRSNFESYDRTKNN